SPRVTCDAIVAILRISPVGNVSALISQNPHATIIELKLLKVLHSPTKIQCPRSILRTRQFKSN
ncbi:hypothetical protein BGZ95_001902, partial [Linnemannia exigua]